MREFPAVKIEIFVPEGHVEAVREALAAAGAGVIGDYDHCVSITPVTGCWRPLEGARPFEGEVGEVSCAREYKVEVNCPAERVNAALAAVRAAHPYEEPVINVLPLLNHHFAGAVGAGS